MSNAIGPRRGLHRRAVTLGLIVVLAGCAPSGGGCAPTDETGGTTTTTEDPYGTTTTTEDPYGTTTTTEDPYGTTSTTTTEDPNTTTTTTTTTEPGGPAPVRVEELQVEDCFSPTNADTFVDQVRIVDCDTPHRSEVFAEYELDDEIDYPGGSELMWAAQDECRARFDDYVAASYWDSDFDLTVLTPSYSTWDVGDRTMTCLIVDPAGELLTGPAKNARR